MNKARISCLGDAPKVSAIRDVSIRGYKLRMVRNVEKLTAKFQSGLFRELRFLVDPNIEIVDPRPATHRAWRVSNGAQHLRLEDRRIKEQIVRAPGIHSLERLNDVWLARQFEVIAVHQLQVIR